MRVVRSATASTTCSAWRRTSGLLRIIGGELHEAEVAVRADADRLHGCSRTSRTGRRRAGAGARRVVGKAEHLAKGANPRFVVTVAAGGSAATAQTLYEEEYCARGEMENRIKEQQLYLFADRTSSHDDAGESVAAVVLDGGLCAAAGAAGRSACKGTPLASAQCDTIRLKLLEDRRAGPGERAAGGGVAVRGVPVPGGVRAGAEEPPASGVHPACVVGCRVSFSATCRESRSIPRTGTRSARSRAKRPKTSR